jgi:CBS domain-containing protein
MNELPAEAWQDGRRISDLSSAEPIIARVDEPLRAVAYRMAEAGVTTLPVVERGDPPRLVGLISLQDLLLARKRILQDERQRERVFHIRTFVPARLRRSETASVDGNVQG